MKSILSVRQIARVAALFAGLLTSVAYAQLSVEITGAGANRLPLAIADLAGDRIVSQAITSVVRSDLERSGLFRLVDAGAALTETSVPPWPTAASAHWRMVATRRACGWPMYPSRRH